MQQSSTERLCQIRVSTYLIPFFLILQRILCRQQNNGNMLVRKSSFNFRHITIPFITGIMISLTIISGMAAQRLFQTLFTIGGSPHFKIVRERFYNIITDVPIIFHYQQNTLTTMHRFYYFLLFRPFSSEVFSVDVSMQHMRIRVIRQQTDIKSTSHIQRTFNLISPSCKTTRFFTRARPIPVPEA